MAADGTAVGDVTVTVNPAAAVSNVVRREATVVARVSRETPKVERLTAATADAFTVGTAPGNVVYV